LVRTFLLSRVREFQRSDEVISRSDGLHGDEKQIKIRPRRLGKGSRSLQGAALLCLQLTLALGVRKAVPFQRSRPGIVGRGGATGGVTVRRIVYCVVLALATPCFLRLVAAKSHRLTPATSYALPNGLVVVIREDHTTPNVAVELWVRAGSRYEDSGHWGQAHFLEHMMGATRLPVAPGRVLDGNAQTRRDFCRYYLLIGAESIEYALAVQADRLDFPLSAMNEARLNANRDIVLNEYRGNESRPFGFGSTTDVKMLVNTYGPQHPYGRPIQLNGDVSRLTPEDMRFWLANRYLPSESLLLVVGDLSPDRVRALVEKYFDPIPSVKDPSVPPRARVTIEPLRPTPEKHEQVHVAAPAGRLFAAWATPRYGSPEADYLALFDEILAAPETGRLYRRLVYQERLATATVADTQLEELAGSIRATVELRPGADFKKAESLLLETVAELAQTGPTDTELATAKAVVQLRFAHELERLGFQGSESELIGEGVLFTSDAGAYEKRLNRIRHATPSDVLRAALAWVLGHGYFLTAIAGLPIGTGTAIDRTQPVSLPPLVPPTFPAVETVHLKDGLSLVSVLRSQSLLTNVTVVVPADRAETIEQRSVLARALTDRDPSNQTVSADAWRAAIAGGCSVERNADNLATTISLDCLAEDSSAALKAAATLFGTERVGDSVLRRVSQDAALSRVSLDDTARARDELATLLAGVPGNFIQPASSTATSPEGQCFRLNGATLIITGPTSLAELETKINEYFVTPAHCQDHAAGEQRTESEASVAVESGLYAIDVPGRVQTVIVAGNRLPPVTMDNLLIARLATAVAANRINTDLREQHHWAYGAQATIATAPDGVPTIVLSTEVQADKTADAISEIRHAWGKEVRATDTARLALYRRDLTRQMAGDMGGVSGIDAALADLVRLGLPPTAYSQLLPRAASVDGTSLDAALQLLQNDKLVFVLAGDIRQLRPQLDAAGLKLTQLP
jgi:zinc protease